MLRVDIIGMTDNRKSQKLLAGVGLFNGKVQLLEGLEGVGRDVIRPIVTKDRERISPADEPELFLQSLVKAYRGTYAWASEAYEDSDANYDANGKFVGTASLAIGRT